jgi:hypothetical protein
MRHKNYRILTGKPNGKIPLGRPKRRLKDNTKLALKETERQKMAHDKDVWIVLANTVINLRVPQQLDNFLNC